MMKKLLVGLMTITTVAFATPAIIEGPSFDETKGSLLKIEPIVEKNGEVLDLRFTIMIGGTPIVVEIERSYLQEMEELAQLTEQMEKATK